MTDHFRPEDYELTADDRRTISIDGNKIMRFFFEQASTDPISTRKYSSSDGKREWLADCKTILDIGAGCGQTVAALRAEHKVAMGVTANPKEIIIAKKEFDIDLTLADMHDLPFPDNTFDGIIMWDVLEHSIAPFIALTEVRRVLKMGGKLLVFMPSETDWVECIYHYSVMNSFQMNFLFRRLGFELHAEKDGIYEARKVEFNKEEFYKKYFK